MSDEDLKQTPGACSQSKPEAGASSQKVDLSKIRHELRTPINHIIGYSEMLQEDAGTPPAFAADLQKIHMGGRQLLNVINEYFDDENFSAKRDLRDVFHELRTPVNQIVGYSEILQEDAIAAGREDLLPDLRRISEAAGHWLALMEAHLIPADQTGETTTSIARIATHAESSSVNVGIGFRAPTPKASFSVNEADLLVVDDDEGNREMLSRRLKRQGYKVTVAATGLEALKLVRAKKFDLVLLDLILPGLDGYQVLAKMKSDPALRSIPVIMISALDQEDGIARCLEMEAEDYVAKPFNPVFLKARIEVALEKMRLRAREQIHLKLIEEERATGDRLLLNVLPQPIAERLKNGETTIVDSFPEVTVLFADLVGFTALSLHIGASEMVQLLNEIFSAFDVLATRHGLEKIKTIGDAYMAVAGVPTPRPNHARAAAALALDMLGELAKFNQEYRTSLRMRIGISSGPVIAGIIGRNKFSYDLWGDTVNTASRMESHGVTGQIQVSSATYELLKETFQFQKREAVEVKGMGTMDVFILRSALDPAKESSEP